MKETISRRDFLKVAFTGLGGLIVAGCNGDRYIPASEIPPFLTPAPTRDIFTPTPTPTETPTPTPTETATTTSTETPTVVATSPLELSSEQLAEKNFVGSGFEIKTEFQGIPVDLTVVTSKATLAQYNQTRGCMPNQEMVKYGASAEDRMAEMVFLGHYVGYLEDTGLTEGNYPFEQYMLDLKAGKDKSYTTWGPRLDGTDGEFMVDPRKPVEYLTTNEKVDPDGNGRGTTRQPDNVSSLGYQQLENGGLRIVNVIPYTYNNYFWFCIYSSAGLDNSLLSLGVPLEFLQGRIQLILPNYPATQARLNEIYIDMQTYEDSNGSLRLAILAP